MNSTIYYIPEAKTQPNFHQTHPNYQQGPNQPNYYQNQPNYGQNQPGFQQNQNGYYQNQTQPNAQQYQQNFSQQANYQQSQYNYQPSQPQTQANFQQNQSYPQQTQPSTQQYQPNYAQNQPSNIQQSQTNNVQQSQTNNVQQSLSSLPLAESNYIQQPNPQHTQGSNIQQSQANPYQNQSTYPQSQPNYGQSQTNYGQTQPNNIQQSQPTTQQNQQNIQQENFSITLDSFAPQNANMGPSQMLPNNNMAPSQMVSNYNMAPSQMLPSTQANKFGISIDITGENTYQEDSIPYTLYTIQGYSQKGQFSTAKGYMDFVNIHFLLTAKFPGSKKYLEIPDKTLFLKLEDSNIEARRTGLAKFLKSVACSQEIFYCADFQTFLSTTAYPAKQQVEFLRKHNPFIMYNNPALQQDVIINIVKEYEKSDGILLKHKEYVIQGADQKGQFTVSRRYKDFVKIREILVAKYPGVPFVHLPVVTSHGVERTNGLLAFLRSIPKTPFAYQSTEFQLFIRYAESDFKKKLKPFHKSPSVLKTILK